MSELVAGFSAALSAGNLLACAFGVFVGTVVGVLPGLGPVGTMGLVLPLTFGMSPQQGLIMLAGIYYGAMYGGSTTSILMNVPGEAASVVTCIDGYKMALKGKAGSALAVAAIGSFLAGTLSLLGLILFAPLFARLALRFGPAEYLGIAILGLVTLANLTGRSPLKSSVMVCLGIIISTVGIDPVSGHGRFTFGSTKLMGGIELVPLIMGLYGVAEVMRVVERPWVRASVPAVRFRELYPSRQDLRRAAPGMFRGSIIGFLVGLIPGPAAVTASFAAYLAERKLSRRSDEFGKGAIEGVAAAESANNAACAGSMVPLLALGLPFGTAAAVLLSGFLIHGIRPGPLLISQHPDIFWTLIASMYIGNLFLLILNLPLVGVFASIMRVPNHVLLPVIVLIVVVGAYATTNDVFSVWVMLIAAVVGYVLQKLDFDPAPLVVGYVMGPIAEEALGQSLLMARGGVSYWLGKPILIASLIGCVLFYVLPPLVKRFRRGVQQGSPPDTSAA